MARVSADTWSRRPEDAWFGGVCACLADRLGLDPLVVRILTVVVAFVTFGVGAVVYAVLWARIPVDQASDGMYDVWPEQAESSAYGLIDVGAGAGGSAKPEQSGLSVVARLGIAVCLMLLFLAVAVGVSPMVDGTQWWQFWPLAWVICGLCLMVMPFRSNREAAWHAVGIAITAFASALLPVTLGIMSWGSFGAALERMWYLAAISVVLFGVGYVRNNGAFMMVGACCLALFFVLTMAFFGVPGEIDQLVLKLPGREVLRIAAR